MKRFTACKATGTAVQYVEGGEQGRGAVAFVVEGQRARLALFHRQARLGPIERLDLALSRFSSTSVRCQSASVIGARRGNLRPAPAN